MTLDQLRSFRAIVEAGSFRAAAERMNRTQPAVTHQIKVLERELGNTLLDRKTARPTAAGQRLFERACALLSDADSLERGMREFSELESGELRLGTSDTTALYVLPRVIGEFRRAAPHAKLHIVNRPTETIAQLVMRGDLDVGILTLPTRKRELSERLLFKQELVLITPTDWPLKRRRGPMELKELAGAPMLMLEEQTRTGKLLREHFRANGFDPDVVLDTTSFEVIKRYVAEGIGISFLPRNAVTDQDNVVVIDRIPGLPTVDIGAVWRKGAYQSQVARVFMGLL